MDDTQALILDQLREQSKTLNAMASDVACLKQAQIATTKRFESCANHVARTAAVEKSVVEIHQRLKPVEMLAYGGVAVALLAVIGAILAGVLR